MCENSKKNGGWGSRVGLGGHVGCEWRSEAFVKIQKKKYFFFCGGGGSGQGVGLGRKCQGGWERRIEAFVKIPPKKILFFFGEGGWVGLGGSGWM